MSYYACYFCHRTGVRVTAVKPLFPGYETGLPRFCQHCGTQLKLVSPAKYDRLLREGWGDGA